MKEQFGGALAEREAENEALQEKLKFNEALMEDLRQQQANSRLELEMELKQRDVQASKDAAEKQRLQDEYESLTRQHHKAMKAQETKDREMTDLYEQLEKKELAMKEQKKKYEKAIAEKEHMVQMLTSDKEKFSRMSKEQQDELAKMNNKLIKLSGERDDIKATHQRQADSLKDAERKMKQLERERDEMQAEFKKHERSVLERERKMMTLEFDQKDLERKLEALQKKETDLQGAMADLKQSSTDAKQELIKQQELTAKKEAEVEVLMRQKAELEKQVAVASTDAGHRENTFLSLLQEKNDLQARLLFHEKTQEDKDKALDELRSENSTAAEALKESQAELQKQQEQLEALERELEAKELKYSSLIQEKSQIRDSLARNRQSKVNKEELLRKLAAETELMQDEVEISQQELATKDAEIAQLVKSQMQLQESASTSTEKLQTLMQQYDEMKTRNEELSQQVDDLKTKANALQDMNTTITERYQDKLKETIQSSDAWQDVITSIYKATVPPKDEKKGDGPIPLPGMKKVSSFFGKKKDGKDKEDAEDVYKPLDHTTAAELRLEIEVLKDELHGIQSLMMKEFSNKEQKIKAEIGSRLEGMQQELVKAQLQVREMKSEKEQWADREKQYMEKLASASLRECELKDKLRMSQSLK
eukprot:TRINITY_DN62719_c0_g1_i3.p1 TRINITY_DN62719_c0_g1~~TRINITY_DN62719_c0_g1_i3.p1  ORF type:complete len:756 (-),score=114.68 TRINITY_DN62719_c0_g1_i3:123-2072(-)